MLHGKMECLFAESSHLQSVTTNCIYDEGVSLNEADLHELSKYGKYKILKDDRIKECFLLKRSAGESPAIVALADGEKCIHFLVLEKKVCYYSKLQRVVISCNIMDGALDGRCCRRKRLYLHKHSIFGI